jgi:hypothetical protein
MLPLGLPECLFCRIWVPAFLFSPLLLHKPFLFVRGGAIGFLPLLSATAGISASSRTYSLYSSSSKEARKGMASPGNCDNDACHSLSSIHCIFDSSGASSGLRLGVRAVVKRELTTRVGVIPFRPHLIYTSAFCLA